MLLILPTLHLLSQSKLRSHLTKKTTSIKDITMRTNCLVIKMVRMGRSQLLLFQISIQFKRVIKTFMEESFNRKSLLRHLHLERRRICLILYSKTKRLSKMSKMSPIMKILQPLQSKCLQTNLLRTERSQKATLKSINKLHRPNKPRDRQRKRSSGRIHQLLKRTTHLPLQSTQTHKIHKEI